MKIRYIIDVYKVEIPDNELRDDIDESAEDRRDKVGKDACYQFQMQGRSLYEIAERLARR